MQLSVVNQIWQASIGQCKTTPVHAQIVSKGVTYLDFHKMSTVKSLI